ncbi:DNA cytosine methyltransferase [Halalkaliarchaeum desulfuricum]|uniref:DNA cytosine methyltransferase n=1 Tax=Halalkaliarchaeum desulfuricum TaxID=2055893 RepID=UPI001FEC8947|nr:DNA cytosine methyltransferase [Halalkaliarchaeum desulfuricum]
MDLFAGAGGLSTGIAQACEALGGTLGEDVRLVAINHSEDAIATHEQNHPWAEHYHAKIEELHPPDVVDPGAVTLLAGGPSCTHHSNARGGKPIREQERASAWHVLHWIQQLRPEQLLIENVPEFRSWSRVIDGEATNDGAIYQQWIQTLQALGYTIIRDDRGRYGVTLRACDYGDPTSRRRLFVIGSRTHKPTAPEPTHSADPEDDLREYRTAATIIDWSDRGESIWARSRPLAKNTMQRIAEGIRRHCDDRLAPYADVVETLGPEDVEQLQDDVVPIDDLETAVKERTEPFLVTGEVAIADGGVTGEEPDPGAVLVMGQHSGAYPRDAQGRPVPTVTTTGAIHHIAVDAFVKPRNLPQRGVHSNATYDPGAQPAHTITARNHDGHLVSPYLIVYNGQSDAADVDEPLPTVRTKARHALIEPDLFPWGLDIRYRLLEPHETKQAQGFPADYEICGDTKRSVRKQIGNAVPVNLARALGAHILSWNTPSLSTFGGGVTADPETEIPAYAEVSSTDD